jgi:hypothetical protein
MSERRGLLLRGQPTQRYALAASLQLSFQVCSLHAHIMTLSTQSICPHCWPAMCIRVGTRAGVCMRCNNSSNKIAIT